MTQAFDSVPPAPKLPSPRALASAENDLEYWFTRMHADLAISASGFEPATVGGESDICGATIVALADFRHAKAVRAYYRIRPRIERLPPEFYADAQSLYVPPRVHGAGEFFLREYFFLDRKTDGQVTLVGLAMRTAAFAAAWLKGTEKLKRTPTYLEWLQSAFAEPGGSRPRWCREARDAALKLRERLLVAYLGGGRT
jgi:hypothetical protein